MCLGSPHLTNVRYADDEIVYAKSPYELEIMTEKLLDELRKIGLRFNATKIHILRSKPSEDDLALKFQ